MGFSSSGGAKVGSIEMFGGSVAPDGYLFCNGGAISRTLYSDLFAVIGTTYGAGDGSTTFNLPNFPSGKVITGNIPVIGTGIALGISNGANFAGTTNNPDYGMSYRPSAYGKAVGQSTTSGSTGFGSNYTIGITTEASKSGIVADLSTNQSVKYIIKY